MHGPNSLSDARLASPRAPAQVVTVGHENILREASLALSLSDEHLFFSFFMFCHHTASAPSTAV